MTRVDRSDKFEKELQALARKYRKVIETVAELIGDLERGERPGDQIPGVGLPTYKVRLPNVSARRGKSGGFRTIYYVKVEDHVILLTIFSKTDIENLTVAKIRGLVDSQQSSPQADTPSTPPTPSEPPATP